MDHAARGFRSTLRRELTRWRSEGIVDERTAEALAARYALAEAAPPAPRLAALCVAGAGLALVTAALVHGPASFHPLVAAAALLIALPLVAGGEAAARRAEVARVVGRIAFYALALAASFRPVADALRLAARPPLLFFVALVPLVLLLAAALVHGLRRADVDPLTRGEALLAAATMPAFLAGLSLETGAGAALVANLAVAFLAVGRIFRGLSWKARAPLVEGAVVGVALVAARFVELLR